MSRPVPAVEVPAVDPLSSYYLPATSDVWLFARRRVFHSNAGGVTDCGLPLWVDQWQRAVPMPVGALRLDVVLPCRRCYP